MFSNEKTFSSKAFSEESGLGLMEVVISMSLLGILAISFIPVLTNSWKDTSTNTTIATATQIVNEKIEGARAVRSAAATSPSCQDVLAFLNVTLAPVIDPRGISLLPQWSATTCPSSYPGVVRAQVLVTRPDKVTPVASAVTMIFVKSAV